LPVLLQLFAITKTRLTCAKIKTCKIGDRSLIVYLKPLLEEALNLLKGFEYEIKWIPREENQEADELSKEPLVKTGIIKAESEKEKCLECNGNLIERRGKYGKFYDCLNYPKCRFTKRIKD
jgi:ssDNA-binding Zn-finger/Zn-ribbon topoisomerase 1